MNKAVQSKIELIDRGVLRLDGVEDILSFDEHSVYLKTVQGNLNIDGNDLHITRRCLEEGELVLSGHIDGLYYVIQTEKKKGGLFSRAKS
ncbi:MAG: YabP/YqfC family sporulation protein [Clostridia bacterium]|nr:YabP/YqfC family sporulation protein [Clostridia bacterium]